MLPWKRWDICSSLPSGCCCYLRCYGYRHLLSRCFVCHSSPSVIQTLSTQSRLTLTLTPTHCIPSNAHTRHSQNCDKNHWRPLVTRPRRRRWRVSRRCRRTAGVLCRPSKTPINRRRPISALWPLRGRTTHRGRWGHRPDKRLRNVLV